MFLATEMRRAAGPGIRCLLLCLLLIHALPAGARTVVVGVYRNSPKIFMDEEGRPRGFFVELLEAMAADSGWRLEWRPCPWERCLDLLADGTLDLMPDVAWTSERARRLRFGSEVALSSWSVFYTRPEHPLYSLLELDGARVAVVRGSVQYQALRGLARELAIEPRYLEVPEMAAAFRSVRDGEADAALVNVYFGRRHARGYGLSDSRVVVRPALLYIAASPGAADALLPVIDDHLRAWKQDRDSVYHRALQHWLVRDRGRLARGLFRGLLLGLAAALFLLGLVLLFRALLRRRTAELEAKQRHLDHLAHHDPLTGLPNRLLFFDRLEQSIRRGHRQRRGFALLFLDLDQFKQINDTFGHELGDRLLKQVAERLCSAVRESDTVARIGGDEFAVILEGLQAPSDVVVGVQHLVQAFEEPFDVGGHRFTVSCSIGIALYPQDGEDVHTLLRNADTAMFRAKAAGRNTYRLYDEEMTRETVARARMETALRQAVERGELEVRYQPQHALEDGRLVGFEALLRWRHPDLGEVPPAQFLPLAEETGLMERVGARVLEAACRQVAAWRRAGLPQVRMAVNLSCRQLRDPALPEQVARRLEETGCPASALEFEVTENFVMSRLEPAVATLERLRAMGIELAIDDFGTGYSSLAYLKTLPLSRLKIDRSFVGGVPGDENDSAIVRAVVALAHALGLKVLAEGVEREEQVEFLRDAGCDEVQGYLYGAPVTAEEATRRLEGG